MIRLRIPRVLGPVRALTALALVLAPLPAAAEDPIFPGPSLEAQFPEGQAAGSPNGGGISKTPLAPFFGEIPAEAVVIGGAVIVGGVVIALLLGDDNSNATVSTQSSSGN